MTKRKRRYSVTMTVSTPHDLRPERLKFELQSRINELCGYASHYPGEGWPDAPLKELGDRDIRAMSIAIRRAK